jgi:hypothetical protein
MKLGVPKKQPGGRCQLRRLRSRFSRTLWWPRKLALSDHAGMFRRWCSDGGPNPDADNNGDQEHGRNVPEIHWLRYLVRNGLDHRAVWRRKYDILIPIGNGPRDFGAALPFMAS